MGVLKENQGRFDPLTEEEEIIALLNQDQPARAAHLIRKLQSNTSALLNAIADMLDGDAKECPELKRHYSYRLALASWGVPCAKPKRSTVKAKNNAGYKRKRPSPGASDPMIASKIRRLIQQGLSRKDALIEAATHFSSSVSKVEKAYDQNKKRLKPVSAPKA